MSFAFGTRPRYKKRMEVVFIQLSNHSGVFINRLVNYCSDMVVWQYQRQVACRALDRKAAELIACREVIDLNGAAADQIKHFLGSTKRA